MTFSAHLLMKRSPKQKKPSGWLQETWYIRLSQGVFVVLTINFTRQTGGNVILTGFYYLNFLTVEFEN